MSDDCCPYHPDLTLQKQQVHILLLPLINNPLYAGILFHCYMRDESICHFRGVGSIFVAFILDLMERLFANSADPDQTPDELPHNELSHLGNAV